MYLCEWAAVKKGVWGEAAQVSLALMGSRSSVYIVRSPPAFLRRGFRSLHEFLVALQPWNQTRAVSRRTLQQVNMPTRVLLMSRRPLSGHYLFADEFGFDLPPIAVGSLGVCMQGTGDHRLATSRVKLSLDISRRMSYLLSLIGFCGLASSLARH